jgi:hypothetical protein
VCFFDLDEDGLIAALPNFWPESAELPERGAHLVERC